VFSDYVIFLKYNPWIPGSLKTMKNLKHFNGGILGNGKRPNSKKNCLIAVSFLARKIPKKMNRQKGK
jgi:hypothetical protein